MSYHGYSADTALFVRADGQQVEPAGGGGGSAPVDAQYVVLALNATLTNERRLVVGSPITLVDAGAGSTVTLDFDETVTLGNNARVAVAKAGTGVGTRRKVNFIEGTGISLTVTDDSGNERVDVEIATSGAGTGTVTSVAIAMPTAVFDVSGSPITTSGTITVTLDNQTANTIFAGPTNGSAAAPTFRAMVAADIPVNIVGLGKIQQITTDRLLGRDTAGTGDVEQLTVGGGLEFTGSGGIQRSALTGDVTASAGSGSTTIANDAVTYAKMQNSAAGNVFIGRSAGTGGDLGEIAIGASQLAGRGSSGNLAAITLGTNLSMSGTTLNASGGSGPTTGVQILTSDDSNSSGVLGAINSDLPIEVDADSVYLVEYYIIWQSSSTSSGVAFSIHVGFSFPAQFLLMHSEVPTDGNTTVTRWQTDQAESGTITTSNTIDAANANRFALVRVTIKTHAATPADIQLRYHGDGSDTITIKAGTFVRWTKIA